MSDSENVDGSSLEESNSRPVRPNQNTGQPVPVPTPDNTSNEDTAAHSPNLGYKIPEVVKESYKVDRVTYADEENHFANVSLGKAKNSGVLSIVLSIFAGVALMGIVVFVGVNLVPKITGTPSTVQSGTDIIPRGVFGTAVTASYEKMKAEGIKEYIVYSYGDSENNSEYSRLSYYSPTMNAAVSCINDCASSTDHPTVVNVEEGFVHFLPGRIYENFNAFRSAVKPDGTFTINSLDRGSNTETIILTVDKNGLIVSAEGQESDGVRWVSTIEYGVDEKGMELFKEAKY